MSFLFIYAYGQDTKSPHISDFTAKIKKGNADISWLVHNPVQNYTLKLEYKKPTETDFGFFENFSINSFDSKIVSDSLTVFKYNYKLKLEENGVYFFKITLLDNFSQVKNTYEIKLGVSEINECKLYQNSPNPFNPSTSITYELLKPTNVTLKVYSLQGKEIDVLVDEFQHIGTYKIDFNTSNYKDLASGIYFYKLKTTYSSDIKKMIFTK